TARSRLGTRFHTFPERYAALGIADTIGRCRRTDILEGTMRNSAERILTSHAGSLPRPDDLIELNRQRLAGESDDEAGFQRTLSEAVRDLVRRQREVGIDVPGDGEFGKAMGDKGDYGAWWTD